MFAAYFGVKNEIISGTDAKLDSIQQMLKDVAEKGYSEFEAAFEYGHLVISATKKEIVPFRGMDGKLLNIDWNSPDYSNESTPTEIDLRLPPITIGDWSVRRIRRQFAAVDGTGIGIGVDPKSRVHLEGAGPETAVRSMGTGKIEYLFGPPNAIMVLVVRLIKRTPDADILVVGLTKFERPK